MADAGSFGSVVARLTAVLRELTGAEMVYALMFGDHVPHLHVNLVPHRAGDAAIGGERLLDPAAPVQTRELHEAFVGPFREAVGGPPGR